MRGGCVRVVTALGFRHLESELGPKAVQHVKDFGTLDKQSYTTVAVYLQMVTNWRARKVMAQLRTGSRWLAEETGRWIGQPHEQRRNSGAIDNAAQMVLHCAALTAERRRHPELCMTAATNLRTSLEQNPISIVAFVLDCFNACDTTLTSSRDCDFGQLPR